MTSTPQRDDWKRRLGSTGISVTAVAAGGGPLGGMPEAFGYDVPADQGVDLVAQLLDSPIRVIDTANGYSDGESERRIGAGIERHGSLPRDYLIATKVDGKGGDYSGARVRRSIEESMERLDLTWLPLVHLHDPEYALDQDLEGKGGAVETLVALQGEGVVGSIGLAGGDIAVMHRFLDLDVFDVILSHNRWTLLDRSAESLIERATASGIGVINAAYLGGGLLANPDGPRRYGYRPAADETVTAAVALRSLAERFGTDLPTAALQFSLRDPRVHMSVVGISKPERLDPLLASVDTILPDEFWAEAETLLPDPSLWLDPPIA